MSALPEIPSVWISDLTFSSGYRLDLMHADIVVFVGPNNSGKSATLKEIEGYLSGHETPRRVVKDIISKKIGTVEDVRSYLAKNSHASFDRGHLQYFGPGCTILDFQIDIAWKSALNQISAFFCRRIKTETRITDSNPERSFHALNDPPSNPIQLMYADSNIELRLSNYFEQAFGLELIVFRAGGNEIPLMVGKRPGPEFGQDPTKREYIERLYETAVPLEEQGDGMRAFASVVLEMLASQTPTILLLDEPEAFLHPPQARLIGRFLAREKRRGAQLFIATHSSDILSGLLEAAPDQLRVVRISRDGEKNIASELSKEMVTNIRSDPLMRYSSVLDAIFHRRTILCESDADCFFYQAVLNAIVQEGEENPDVLFLHASGKHRMAKIAAALVSLDVQIDIIADIDLLSEENTFRDIVSSMNGDWNKLKKLWRNVKLSIEERKPWLNAESVQRQINEAFSNVDRNKELSSERVQVLRSILKKASPWESVKEAGDAAIPPGDATKSMQEIRSILQEIGIWIVPVGELEGFCKSVGGHGPRWVQKVIEERDLSTDGEIEPARSLIHSLWNRKTS